jgi:hypothetical protein
VKRPAVELASSEDGLKCFVQVFNGRNTIRDIIALHGISGINVHAAMAHQEILVSHPATPIQMYKSKRMK